MTAAKTDADAELDRCIIEMAKLKAEYAEALFREPALADTVALILADPTDVMFDALMAFQRRRALN